MKTKRLASAAVTALAIACARPSAPPSPTGAESVTVASDAGAISALVVSPSPAPPRELARWVPAEGFEDLGDGRRVAVVSGRRLVLRDGNATVIDAEVVAGLGRGHRVPQALGGGWLFASAKSVYFGATFEGALRLVATDIREEGLGVGHDCILVRGTNGAPVVVELSTGKKLRGVPVPDVDRIFGIPTGEVAARTANGDLYLSSARGRPFAKVQGAGRVDDLAFDGTSIVVRSSRGEERLGRDGRLTPRPQEPGMVTSDDLFALREPWPDLSKPPPAGDDADKMLSPLTVAISERAVIAVKDGTSLVVFDGKTGKESTTQQGVFAGHANCFPIRGGTPAFIGCNDPLAMSLFRIDAPDRPPVLERTFRGVYTQDFGSPPPDAPLALAKTCAGADVRGAFCVRHEDKTWVDVAPPSDPEKLAASLSLVVHVAASSDGGLYAFGWKDGNGDLVVIDGRAKVVRRVSKSDMPKWAQDGLRWDAVTVRADAIRFLVAGEHPGVMELRSDGHVQGDALAGRMASIGARALLVTPDGALRETIDGGRSFRDVPPPPGGARGERARCAEGGCTVGPWHRLGWGP